MCTQNPKTEILTKNSTIAEHTHTNTQTHTNTHKHTTQTHNTNTHTHKHTHTGDSCRGNVSQYTPRSLFSHASLPQTLSSATSSVTSLCPRLSLLHVFSPHTNTHTNTQSDSHTYRYMHTRAHTNTPADTHTYRYARKHTRRC